MKLSIRFFVQLLFALGLLAYVSVLAFDRMAASWIKRDLEVRSGLAARALRMSFVPIIERGAVGEAEEVLNQVTKDERLYAVGFCDRNQTLTVRSEYFPDTLKCPDRTQLAVRAEIHSTPAGPVHVTAIPIEREGHLLGSLLFVHDMSYAAHRSEVATQMIFGLFLLLAVVVAGLTYLLLRFAWRGWVEGVQAMIRDKGQSQGIPGRSMAQWLPVLHELRGLVTELEADRKVQDGGRVVWDPKALKEFLSSRLSGEEILIVSNREPYIHNRKNGKIEVQLPASGLVAALEPVMRACSGVWIASGTGSADREVVDEHDRVWVPPGEESFQIRRVWVTPEEDEGYYYGFSNEGLWPLCHIAHTRPIFRSKDWDLYQQINERFAAAVVQEAKTEDPVVMVQDYHFAMLPALVRKALPRATIITFWHIPWPNPEAFGICPWREEILRGLLGSTILGFHTRFHRNNFLDTCDRFIECRIDREHFTVSHQGRLTAVRSYPISIEWPPKYLNPHETVEECRREILKRHQLPARTKIALGVERLDYTKGVLERFAAVERFFELNPEWIGHYTLIQVAAPSRTHIAAYSQFGELVQSTVKRINERFSDGTVMPIILLQEHHDPKEVFRYLRAADVCLITSLHDGMNLVAKEFVAARTDEQGVLILSMFAGASRELPEALIVNPYNIDQIADAMRLAIEMPAEEQQSRMRSMRDQVREFNVYRWAGRMLSDAAYVRERMRLQEELSELPVS